MQLHAGASGITGITGDTGASGQTGVTGGWTLLPSQETSASLVPWRCHRIQVMGGEGNVCNHLQALAASRASRATRVPPVKRVSQVGGCFYHQLNPVLVLRPEVDVIAGQVMGGDAIVCNHMQAQAASRATRVPLAKRVSQVGGHFSRSH